ncbi:hypothetical protein [Curtobacterium flaccumfaciens]|uniref:hypothetical protein n=1 Tax=Curtobacterium flaccumfaciens TaxID=2035 RepID=UPI0039965C5B
MTTLIVGEIVDPTLVPDLLLEEAAALTALRRDGIIGSSYRSATAPQYVGFSDMDDLSALDAAMQQLPFVTHGAMTVRYQRVDAIPLPEAAE